VIAFGGELLKLSEGLLKSGLHTSEIVSGYQRAYVKALEILPTLVVNSLKNVRDTDELQLYIKSVIATKQYGYEKKLSLLVAEACQTTFSPTAKNPKLNIDSVRIAKLRGGSVPQSSAIKGTMSYYDNTIYYNYYHCNSYYYYSVFFIFYCKNSNNLFYLLFII
jgi:T-complex protein 1 subunit theta